MPTTITIPIAERTKSVQYGATYSSALTFNPDKALLVGCSAVLAGMGVTVNTGPVPAEATVAIGSFIQNGIIINVTSAQTLQFPAAPIAIPLYLVAENDNETYNSSVQFLFTTAPAADSVIIAEWLTGIETDFQMPIGVSNCALRDAISGVQMLIIQRDRQAAIAGQTVFTLAPGKSYVLGANKIWVYRNGKKLDVSNDYVETSTTSITIFMPAISGDIFEFMIFKGAPPITSIALDDLTDVTTDLANGIKDTGVIRVSPATAANPLATIADVAAITGFSKISVLKNLGGPYFIASTPSGIWLDAPPPNSITFTPAYPDAMVYVVANCAIDSSFRVANISLMLDGTDLCVGTSIGPTTGGGFATGIPATYEYAGMAYWGDFFDTVTRAAGGSLNFSYPLTGLSLAPHTIKLRLTINAAGATAAISADPASPLVMAVLYK
jgi:hypothetical protein